MNDPGKKLEKDFHLDMPMDEAVERFAKVTKDEISDASNLPALVPDGEIESVPFKGAKIRRVCHNDEWWYSITDVIGALVGTDRASKYWTDLKAKIVGKEGFTEISDFIGNLPLPTADGKMRAAEVATTETLFRIIQSISSPKAEPFKRWLARVGYERIQEWQNPELAVKRAIATYQAQGRTDDWIEKRIRSIVVRRELTSEWHRRGVKKGLEFAMLTNVISEAAFGVHTANHMKIKGLARGHNLRDHMTDMELVLTMLGEASTKEIARESDAQGYNQNETAALKGGRIAGGARKQIEAETGKRVVSSQNFLGKSQRIADPQKLTKKE